MPRVISNTLTIVNLVNSCFFLITKGISTVSNRYTATRKNKYEFYIHIVIIMMNMSGVQEYGSMLKG